MININGLTKMYGEQAAVNNISFEVKQGEIVGFLGPNGAGKSTTMKIITCYMPPTSGEVTVNGKSVIDDSLEVRRMIGYLPEQNPLYMDMNVVDFLTYIAELRELPKDKITRRVGHMVDMCALGEVIHKNVHELSKGYKQRVGLAQAMIHDPEILILDEPTIGLDPNQVVDIRQLIKQVGAEKTVILSTHIMREVEATCDRVIIIHRGNIAADGPLSSLQQDMAGNSTINVEIVSEGNSIGEVLEKVTGIEKVTETFPEGSKGRCFRLSAKAGVDPRIDVFKAVAQNNSAIIGMSREQRSLEEVFHTLTTQALN